MLHVKVRDMNETLCVVKTILSALKPVGGQIKGGNGIMETLIAKVWINTESLAP